MNFCDLIYVYNDLAIHLFYEIHNLLIINEVNFLVNLKKNCFDGTFIEDNITHYIIISDQFSHRCNACQMWKHRIQYKIFFCYSVSGNFLPKLLSKPFAWFRDNG